jgi:curved DNA-binding protein
LRLKGRGIPGKPAGDLYVVLRIELPAADNELAEGLYKKMAQDLAFNPRSSMGV